MRMALDTKYRGEPWFAEICSYLASRYSSIENRIIDVFRYVELHPSNRYTFSHEFGSILRDIGSVFGSSVDRLTRLTASEPLPSRLNFGHYKSFLLREIPNIAQQSIKIRGFDSGVLVPFRDLGFPQGTPRWWGAYNNLKHSEILNYQDGNLENTLDFMGALAILNFQSHSSVTYRLFVNIGIAYPEDSIDVTQKLFFKREE